MPLRKLLLLTAMLVGITVSLLGGRSSGSADCATMPTTSQATLAIHVDAPASYRLWLRQATSTTSTNDIFVAFDDGCAIQVSKNGTPDELHWVGFDNKKDPLIFTLAAGDHKMTIGGDKTGVVVDSGILTSDFDCTPDGLEGNCPQAAEQVELQIPYVQPDLSFRSWFKNISTWIIIFSLIALLATIGFLLWKYHAFITRKIMAPISGSFGAKLSHMIQHALRRSTAQQFLTEHRLVVAICGVLIAFLIASLTFGIVNANQANRAGFEVETGVLSGEAAVVEDPDASAGAAVLFGGIAPIVAAPTTSAPQKTSPGQPGQPGNPGGGNPNPGNPGGGNPNPGGGGGTPAGECPAFPAFPDDSCTGWQHTGVTLSNCDNLVDTNGSGDGWIWEDNPIKTFDKCYFSGNLTIQAPGITIKRSQVHGSISYHGSNGYSFRGLQLIDVEIEQEGVANPRGAIGGADWTCVRCNAHHGVTGMHFGDNTHIRDSYIHDMQWLDGSHGAGIGTGQDHGSNSTIIHNNIQCNRVNGPPICSSALSIYPEDDNGDGITVHNVEVEENLFNATGAYCVYAVSIPGSNINFRNNYFGKKFYEGCAGYGPVTGYGPAGGVWEGNKWADGSGPVIP